MYPGLLGRSSCRRGKAGRDWSESGLTSHAWPDRWLASVGGRVLVVRGPILGRLVYWIFFDNNAGLWYTGSRAVGTSSFPPLS